RPDLTSPERAPRRFGPPRSGPAPRSGVPARSDHRPLPAGAAAGVPPHSGPLPPPMDEAAVRGPAGAGEGSAPDTAGARPGADTSMEVKPVERSFRVTVRPVRRSGRGGARGRRIVRDGA